MRTKGLLFIISLFLIFNACNEETDIDNDPPWVAYTQPNNGALGISTDTTVFVVYSEPIVLAPGYEITVNNEAATANVLENKLVINAIILPGKNNTIAISNRSVKDIADNYSAACSFSFYTKTDYNPAVYEAEDAEYTTNLSVQDYITGYSGSGYVGSFTSTSDQLTFHLSNIEAGVYEIYFSYSTSNWGNKQCLVNVNGSTGTMNLSASSNFSKIKYGRVKMSAGENTIIVTPSYTYFNIDYLQIIPDTSIQTSFQIDETLVTPNPMAAASHLYNFLKVNFQSKIISGTMANYNTNIKEAEWVHTQTGKWPALTGFDLIDYTRNWSWINYSELVENAKNYWTNNGLVALTWHWRDPSRITDEFYTANTSFDITKVNDTNSAEYKAMIEDIDQIATYLKQLKDAGVPVLWRPLHEAAGGWFWWGAADAQSCVTLWKLLFDQLVNKHELNNLIWIWTSDTNTDALNWYPGDNYVDIIGIDIYPGENQHGSQYIQFDKLKEIFKGKKMITLSECGSIPDPALMMEYGDTWSWFMPWNGDYTRSDIHNGSDWWTKIFNYDFVLTRETMPNLK